MDTHIKIGDVSPRIQYTANGTQVQFTYPFPIFQDADLQVYLDEVLQSSGFIIVGAGDSAGGTVDFDSAPSSSVTVTLARRLAIQRTSDFQESGAFRSKVINDELDYLSASLQQVSDDQSRSVQMAITESASVDTTLPSPQAKSVLAWNSSGSGFVNGPLMDDISNAQTYAANAGASATAASLSAVSAATSETNAASSAAAAQTAASSNMYASNESKSADFSIVAADDGKQFLIDTTAGAVTVTLPEGITATDGFRVAFGKTSADNNAVIITRVGTDTINGSTIWQFSSPHGQSVVTLDTTPAPDTWFAAGVGVTAPVGVADLHDNAKPYDIAFIAGFDALMAAEDVAVQTYGELIVPRALALTGEYLYADIAPTGAALMVDVLKNGVSIYATKPQVAAAANAGTVGTLSTLALVAGDRLTFSCTQIGSTIAGGGVRFTLMGRLA